MQRMTGLVVSLLLIAAILFYRLVERRHKILLAKILGVIVLLAGLTIGMLFYFDRRKEAAERDRLNAVSITFIRPAPDSTRNPFRDEHSDTVSQASFLVCNRSNKRLIDLEFFPHTFHQGRSTPYDLAISEPGRLFPYNSFRSDVILAPTVCTRLTWSGRYQVFDSVEAVPFSVKYEGEP